MPHGPQLPKLNPVHPLQLNYAPRLDGATLLLALGGWMDGGLVSTGSVRHVMQVSHATQIGQLDGDGFYIDSFPGSMEIAALFRPEVKYHRGQIVRYERGTSTFHVSETARLAFFTGKEPNFNWNIFAASIFEVVRRLALQRIVFIGSFGGAVPHTREPRLYGSVSHEHLLPLLTENGIRLSDYQGPASFATHLLWEAPRRNVEMISIAAEIPGYLQGANPTCIAAVVRRLAVILDIAIDVSPLRRASTEWELKVTEAVEQNEELAATIRKLEEQYDNELIREQAE